MASGVDIAPYSFYGDANGAGLGASERLSLRGMRHEPRTGMVQRPKVRRYAAGIDGESAGERGTGRMARAEKVREPKSVDRELGL